MFLYKNIYKTMFFCTNIVFCIEVYWIFVYNLCVDIKKYPKFAENF